MICQPVQIFSALKMYKSIVLLLIILTIIIFKQSEFARMECRKLADTRE